MNKIGFVLVLIGLIVFFGIPIISPDQKKYSAADTEFGTVNITGTFPSHWYYFVGGLVIFIGIMVLLLANLENLSYQEND